MDHRQIGLRIATSHLGLHFATVLEDDQNGLGVFNHMVIGQDIPVFAHHHSGTTSVVEGVPLEIVGFGLGPLAAGRLLPAEFLEEPLELLTLLLGQLFVERVTLKISALAVFLGLDLDNDHRLGDRVGHLDECLVELPRQVQGGAGCTRRRFLGKSGNGNERRQQRSPTARKHRIRTHHGRRITPPSPRASESIASQQISSSNNSGRALLQWRSSGVLEFPIGSLVRGLAPRGVSR